MLPLREEYMFNLNGDHPLYINQFDEDSIPHNMQIIKVEEYQTFLKLFVPTQKCLMDYKMPIYLLENQQSLEKYEIAQHLKIMQNIVLKTQKDLNQIIYSYRNHKDELNAIRLQRKLLRQNTVNNFIKHHLNQDDFIIVSEIAGNIELVQTNVESYCLSKPLLSLIGLENEEINSYLLHVGLIGDIFLSDRHKFDLAIMETFTNMGKSKKFQNFTIKTIDKIVIQCNLEMMFLNISYPEEVLFTRSQESSYQDLDQVLIVKYDIQPHHIQQVISYRYSNQNTLLYDYKINQSLEYSLLSQIIIEKYYPQSMKMLQKNLNNKPEELLKCGFKSIAQQ